MADISFKALFFRLYDRKIADGTTTFSQTGIRKSDFTRLCTEAGFVFDDDTINMAADAMRILPEEREELLRLAGEERKRKL